MTVLLWSSTGSTPAADHPERDPLEPTLRMVRRNWTWSSWVRVPPDEVWPSVDGRINALAGAPGGGVIAAGFAQGALIPGRRPSKLEQPEAKTFLARLDRHGALLWMKAWDWGSSLSLSALEGTFVGPSGITALATTADRGLLAAGSFRVNDEQSDDVTILAKLNPSGRVLWTVEGRPSRPLFDWWFGPLALALLEGEEIALAGCEITLAPAASKGPLQHVTQDAFIARYSRNGERRWRRLLRVHVGAKGPDDETRDCATAVAAAPGGDLFVAGTFRNGLDVGHGLRVGKHGGFLARFTSDGEPRWIQPLGPGSAPLRLASLPAGGVAITGAIGRSLRGIAAAAVAGYDSDGHRTWLVEDSLEPSGMDADGMALAATEGGVVWAVGLVADAHVGGVAVAGGEKDRLAACAVVVEIAGSGAVLAVRPVKGYDCSPRAVTVSGGPWIAGAWNVAYLERGLFVHRLPASVRRRR